ncbi:2-succinyl-6-hydroxy-2,4-cyclohexadiene-1-carboxylate synthase [Ferrimonas sediminum]|uniref:Putative 2-succinyl-6-hydroxy-2,4-cyclohexadiene-1-carboxylate synthase n=1 Tax=Ferrimonas sediminum TaxID=718193 RepID=A0A1G8XE58_9GAMM|nr:2-succinyl-6-hydroxy-2,4-cyclohexadiene-1-carboxylate synthase [Ferrimonas sediminum]SDJ88706.1 2-succinyl-6-hydroxy-2,4-cyclohexadiene-1-carboxylate synthase [Ferrimonas sediminum]
MQLHTECHGNPSHPALVLLHGFLGSGEDWRPLVAGLADRYYCITLDLPGHGHSRECALTTAPGFHLLCQAIEASLNRLGVNHYHLLGYSLGGRVALHLAQHCPQRLHSLLIESAHPGLEHAVERRQRLQDDARWHLSLTQAPIGDFLSRWYQQPVFASLSDTARAAMIQARIHNHGPNLGACYLSTSLGHQQDLRPLLASLSLPVHYLCGLQDAKFLALGQQLQQQGLITELHPMPGGHNVHAANGDAFLDTINTILTRYRH